MKIPSQVPANGLYYHYKHDPNGPVSNYAYEVIGVGCHTEDNCSPKDANMVIYRPLYEASVYKAGKFFDLRPLDMWMENATKDGKIFPRFTKVTNPLVIKQLQEIRKQMYGVE